MTEHTVSVADLEAARELVEAATRVFGTSDAEIHQAFSDYGLASSTFPTYDALVRILLPILVRLQMVELRLPSEPSYSANRVDELLRDLEDRVRRDVVPAAAGPAGEPAIPLSALVSFVDALTRMRG